MHREPDQAIACRAVYRNPPEASTARTSTYFDIDRFEFSM
jgi:hypothetical protein